jgi:hypothetical protein
MNARFLLLKEMERNKWIVDKSRSISLSRTGRTRLFLALTPSIIAGLPFVFKKHKCSGTQVIKWMIWK